MMYKKTWLGMLVIVLVFGVMILGCDNGSTNNGSTDKPGNGMQTLHLQNSSNTAITKVVIEYGTETKVYNDTISTGGAAKDYQIPKGTGTFKVTTTPHNLEQNIDRDRSGTTYYIISGSGPDYSQSVSWSQF